MNKEVQQFRNFQLFQFAGWLGNDLLFLTMFNSTCSWNLRHFLFSTLSQRDMWNFLCWFRSPSFKAETCVYFCLHTWLSVPTSQSFLSHFDKQKTCTDIPLINLAMEVSPVMIILSPPPCEKKTKRWQRKKYMTKSFKFIPLFNSIQRVLAL